MKRSTIKLIMGAQIGNRWQFVEGYRRWIWAKKRQKSAGFQAIRGKLTSGANRKSTLTNDWPGFFISTDSHLWQDNRRPQQLPHRPNPIGQAGSHTCTCAQVQV